MPQPIVAVDLSALDYVSDAGGGLHRYGISLAQGLAVLKPDVDAILLGSKHEPPAELKEILKGCSTRWRYMQFEHSRGRGSYWVDQSHYARLLRRERVSVYHSLHGMMPLLAPCPVVITQHDLMCELFPEYELARKSRPYRINRWAVQRFATRVICISETTARDLRDLWGVRQSRIDIVPHGTDFSRVVDAWDGDHIDDLREKSPNPTLVSPYNLEPRKNLAGLLRAVARLRERYPGLKLVLFGRAAITPEREYEFERTVRGLELGDVIEQTGFIEDEDLRRLYSGSDIFVFPSLYEGFGLPVVEAMASGACVVARNASAMADVVGDAGVLVETRNAEVLADAISSLLDDPHRRRRLGESARRRAAAFSIARMAALTWRSYCLAMGNTVGGAEATPSAVDTGRVGVVARGVGFAGASGLRQRKGGD